MALQTWLLCLAAAIGLSLTPGPNSLLVLTHGALHGHRRTLFTVAGGALGFIALIVLSAHRIRSAPERFGKGFSRACGGLFMAMGVALPMTR